MKFIDLFCGIGGFHQALSKLGHECVFACDIDDSCIDIYKKNYNILPFKDIRKINIENIPYFDILCAGFPCQSFSKAGNRKGFEDERGNLFFNICEIIKHHKPKYIILENVKNLTTHDKGRTWNKIKISLTNLNYYTYDEPILLNTLHFSVPQNRERIFILCKRKDIGMLKNKPIVPKIDRKKINTSLKDIVDKKYNTKYNLLNDRLSKIKNIWNEFINICHKNDITIPKFPIWTDSWDKYYCKEDDFYIKYYNWINKNIDFYNKNKKVLEKWLKVSRNEKFWNGSVRKMEWQTSRNNVNLDDLLWSLRSSGIRVKDTNYSPTLVALNQTPIYGPYNRKLVPEELLKLQSFKENFLYDNNIYKQLGNSVNVVVVYNIAKFLINDEKLDFSI